MEIIAKISKGSKMDQIYIPKNRFGFNQGSYVLITPIKKTESTKLFFNNLPYLEPIKLSIIKQSFEIIETMFDSENLIITGSFLNPGFKFNDIDLILISETKIDTTTLENKLKKEIGPEFHIVIITMKSLFKAIETDPLFRYMLNRFVSRKRFIHNKKIKINYKILDLHLLKSKTLVENYEELSGQEKYKLTRNLVAISSFLENQDIKNSDEQIDTIFGKNTVNKLKNNNKITKFKERYLRLYQNTQKKIFQGLKNDSKQKTIN